MTPPEGEAGAIVCAYVEGSIGDEEMTRWLRSVCEHGMSLDDTYAMTLAMVQSGEVIDWTSIGPHVVDKHSTGGVGDAVTLIAVPVAAACGARVPKLSGRALGHTGGTIDKLECFPGLRTDLTVAEIKAQVARIGCAVVAASDQLAPADKKLYALRHRTGTVASIPLIAASVMSKKIAAGAEAITIDVKCGRGAFMQSIGDARSLAATMREIGKRAGRRVSTLITSMDEPLAHAAGDALELDEALTILEGRDGSRALFDVAVAAADAMLEAAGLTPRAAEVLADGSALKKLEEMVEAQAGRLHDFERRWQSGEEIRAGRAGYVARIDARRIGDAIARSKESLPIDAARRVGVRLRRRVGDRVEQDEPLLTYWLPENASGLDDLVTITDAPLPPTPVVLDPIRKSWE